MTQDWTDKKILIAEDEPANFLFLEKIIQPTGATIIHALNGSEAVELIASKQVEADLILMDIFMPDMDGFEAAKRIKRIDSSIPIVAQTFHKEDWEPENFKNAGFDALISKPVNINKLLVMMDHFLKSTV